MAPGVHSGRRFVWVAAAILTIAQMGAVASAPARTAAPPGCGPATSTSRSTVAGPRNDLAWRAAPIARAPVFARFPGRSGQRGGIIRPASADWMLVLGAAADRRGRCWIKLRLPGRPNSARGWVAARRLALQPTRWRLVVSVSSRRLFVLRKGRVRRAFGVVVGAPSTPTPRGLFSVVGAWPGDPSSFSGSWIIGLTAHSNVLRHFEGGSGRVGIHGRGGASLRDPLGTAASHGCIRLANQSIEWLVKVINRDGLPGIPVIVRG